MKCKGQVFLWVKIISVLTAGIFPFIFDHHFLKIYTICVFTLKVQVKFFIPKASQNWIIGDKLIVSKEDSGKKLKDFQITSEILDTVTIYVYVMHTKKANVPKEEHEAIRNRQVEQKKQQQQQQELLGMLPAWY